MKTRGQNKENKLRHIVVASNNRDVSDLVCNDPDKWKIREWKRRVNYIQLRLSDDGILLSNRRYFNDKTTVSNSSSATERYCLAVPNTFCGESY